MPDFFCDSASLHMRDTIFLGQALVDEIQARPGAFGPLTFVARQISLGGAVITDRDVVLVADTIVGGVAGVPLTLRRSGTAKAGVVTQPGQVRPPIPVLGEPPHEGAPGHSLTVLCKTLVGGGAESYGQQGGKGLTGKHENRSICEMGQPGGASPCDGLEPFELQTLEGPKGGKGLPGAKGGRGGAILVSCLSNQPDADTVWKGVGGRGGDGGKGGNGGAGGNALAPRGEPGDPGDRGPAGDDVSGTVESLTQAQWLARVGELTTRIRVGFELFETHKVGVLWAKFLRRQAAEAHRRSATGETAQRLAAANALDPAGAGSELAPQLRDHETRFAVERDLDLPADPDRFEDERTDAIGTLLADAISGLTPAPDGAVPNLLRPANLRQADQKIKAALAALIADGELVEHSNKAGERVDAAGQARKDAHLVRLAERERLTALLGAPANAGVTIAVPAASATLALPQLQALAKALYELAPEIAADGDEDAPTEPSNDVACLLPASADLLVNRSTRESGAAGVYPASVSQVRSTAMDIVEQLANAAAWTAVRQANTTGLAVDLLRVTEQLRSALRPPGAPPLTDPVRLEIVNGLIELAEATWSWRLADLRLEQALESQRLLPTTLEQAVSARDLPVPGSDATLQQAVPTFLARARALTDLIDWRGHRAERACDLYTFGLDNVALDRAAHAPLFDPVYEADLLADTQGLVADSPAAHAARVITRGLDRMAKATTTASVQAYRDRGFETQTDEDETPPFPARRSFCRTAQGPDCIAAPHVFAALEDPLQAGCWLDVDLADVNGPHREAKVRGALLRFEYDLSDGSLPASSFQVELRHGGFSRQLQLGPAVQHLQRGLPLAMSVPVNRKLDNEGNALDVWEGELPDPVAPPPAHPSEAVGAHGRGVAAGYRLQLLDSTAAKPELMTRIDVHVHYEARQPDDVVNLHSVSLSGALRTGVTAIGKVTLTGPAPAGGTRIKLRSSDPSALKVPAEVLVAAGSAVRTFPVEVLGPTGAIPPRLSASSLDGVMREALAPVSKATTPVKKNVTVAGPGATYAAAVGRLGTRSPTGPPPEPTIFLTHTGPPNPDEPDDDGSGFSVHALRSDLTELAGREIGFWPRSIDVDGRRGRVYVVHGPTVSLLDARTLATKAEQLIGTNATTVAVDPVAELVYVTRYSHGTVHVFRGADLAPVQIFGTLETLRGCNGIAFDTARSLIYLARNFRIAEPTATAVTRVVRRPNGEHVIDRDVTVGPTLLQPFSVAVDAPAGLVFVGCLGGGGVQPLLLVLDANTLATLHEVVIPRGAQWVAAREGTGIAYVVTSEGLHLVDGRTGTLALSIKTGTHPQGVAVDPLTGNAYVVDRMDHTLTRVETPASVAPAAWR